MQLRTKKVFLEENYPFEAVPKLTDKRKCIHCDKIITVGDYKAFQDSEDGAILIYCPNAPECDGTVIDWMKKW